MKKVSIVLPTYNSADTLTSALNSISRQSYSNMELIIVNDGSTDDTGGILQEFKNKNRNRKNIKEIKIIKQKNQGAPTARNNGAKQATGEYLMFAESDVILTPDMISTEVRYLNKYPKASYAYCDYNLTGRMQGVFKAKHFNADELRKMNFVTGVSIMKREHFPGYDPQIKGLQDWDMWLTMLENSHTGVYVPKTLFDAIQREEGISADVHKNWEERVLTIYGKHKRVAVFTLTKDRLAYTKRMFKALDEHTNRNYDHFVVDQGSTDGTVEFLKTRKLKKLILNDTNTGISRGSNQALDLIGDDYDYIMKMDNDAEIMTDNWLAEMVKLSVLGDDHAILSPYIEGIRSYGNDGLAGMPRIQSVKVLGHTLGLTTHIGGISVLAPASIYKNFRFNEKDYMSGQQDVSFSAYASQNGYAIAYVEDIKIEHMDTTKGQETKYPEYFKLRQEESRTVYKKVINKSHKTKPDIQIIASSDFDMNPDTRKMWGDYWVKEELASASKKQGYNCIDSSADVVIHLFGQAVPNIPQAAYKIIWIHSHPDTVTPDLLKQYDKVFCISPSFAEKIKSWGIECELMLPATSMKPRKSAYKYDITFVGNARVELPYGRDIVRDLGDTKYDFKVWGARWNDKIPKKNYGGEYIPYKELGKLYASSKINLNDHHEDMRREGFLSFRIFDVLASGGFVISDANPTIDRVFDSIVPQYKTRQELTELIKYYLNNDDARKVSIIKGINICKKHSYINRARELLKDVA